MGTFFSKDNSSLVIHVTTDDRSGAGTDSDVKMILHGENGKQSPEIKLNRLFTNDHERGRTDTFKTCDLSDLWPVKKIEFWRNDFGLRSDWRVQKVTIENKQNLNKIVFPVLRWISANKHYIISQYDSSLPQFDECPEQRKEELAQKLKEYNYTEKEGLPVQIKELPKDESFSFSHKWDLVTSKVKYLFNSKIINIASSHWSSLELLRNVYRLDMGEPNSVDKWSNDLWFGAQRIQGCNPTLIKLCTEIPEKFGVDPECLEAFFGGKSLQEMLEANQLFIVDLEILDNLKLPADRIICAPIALFYLDDKKRLRPVAIQLFQEKGPNNPIFYPSDPPYTWLLAKMWYNNADASHHQSLTHFGFTHLLMEGVCICTHRNLSLSHPLFKLLAPHFLYLLAINTRGIEKLVSVNGWVDKTMTVGRSGMFEIIRKGAKLWRMDLDGTLPNEINSRNVGPSVLPHYPYRDDGLLLYEAISKYVSRIVLHHYDDPQNIKDDYELQSFAHELSLEKDEGGLGLKGVPGNGVFTNTEEIVTTFTSIIFTCSVGHAAANFLQYDEYAYPPNYPSMLRGDVPNKHQIYTDKDIIDQLPNKECTLDVMVVTKLLSERGTKPLGNFEVDYIYDPIGLEAVKQFRRDLKEIGEIIRTRNKERFIPYPLLDPETIPNAISI